MIFYYVDYTHIVDCFPFIESIYSSLSPWVRFVQLSMESEFIVIELVSSLPKVLVNAVGSMKA